MRNSDLVEKASELDENWFNGNKRHVYNYLTQCSVERAIALSALLAERLDGDDRIMLADYFVTLAQEG